MDDTVEVVDFGWLTCKDEEFPVATFSIDVECVASGYGSKDRVVARVAMVDAEENTVLDTLVHPPPGTQVVSYLTQLTGLEEAMFGPDGDAVSFGEMVGMVRALLPRGSRLVGQNIQKDAMWLRLVPGVDYEEAVDIAKLFRVPAPPAIRARYGRKYTTFSLRHQVLHLLGEDIQEGVHDPVLDARYSMRLWLKYGIAPDATKLACARQSLAAATPTPSFSRIYPYIDGVAMRSNLPPSAPPSAPTQDVSASTQDVSASTQAVSAPPASAPPAAKSWSSIVSSS